MNKDLDMVFMDALLYAMEGKNPSKAIENQEEREQRNVVRNQRLPIKTNEHCVPDKCRFNGIIDSMDYSQRSEIVNNNNITYTKEQYLKMGINIIDRYDDLFYNVQLPEGWEIKATEHSMWNDVFDNKGRKRINFFYKGAFYDRDAFSNFNTRYTIGVVPFDNYKTDASYEERNIKPWYGVVNDCDNEIFRTDGEFSSDGSVKSWDIRDNRKKIVLDYINNKYPEWEDINAYWD